MRKDYRKFLLACILSQALFFSFPGASEGPEGPDFHDHDFSSPKTVEKPAGPALHDNSFSSFKASEGPAGLSYLEKSIWRYEYIYKSKGNRGTGFFIGENIFATNLHVLLGGAFLEDILEEEKAAQNIRLSQEGNSSVLRVKRILHISGMHDLALLETEGRASNYLSLVEESPLILKEDLFVSGYPGGVFKRMRSTGYSFYENDYFYTFPVNHSSLSGASGSPVLNDQGFVVGIISEVSGNTLAAIKLNYLKDFVKGEAGLNCLDFAGAGHCLQTERENLKNQAAKGNALAQYKLAGMYYEGGRERKAFHWFQKAAEQDFIPAQYNLAVMYLYGMGTERDPELAFHWFQKAAQQGYIAAQNNLAGMYLYGQGTERNPRLAFYWFQKAAQQGYATAQYNLAIRYLKGGRTEQNFERAFDWLKKSAEQGFALAQNLLAEMYFKGYGLEQDFKKALYRQERAAE